MTKRYQRTERAVTEVRAEDAAEHLGLVHQVCRRMKLDRDDYEELVQVGTLALMRAVHGFRPDLGCAFSTYAVHSIERAIIHFHRFHQMQCRDVRRTVALTDDATRWVGARDRPGRLERDDARRDAADRAAAMLAELEPRDAEVLMARMAGEPMEDIARRMRMSKERVRQIERGSMALLRSKHAGRQDNPSIAQMDAHNQRQRAGLRWSRVDRKRAREAAKN
jgi:RNA polymerase sigma factor (sigma-70 family)